jgi:hypothetical protein
VESLNNAADHMSARRLIAAGRPLPKAVAADANANLKALL